MIPSSQEFIDFAWIVFVAYWIFSARKLKRAAQAESGWQRLPHILTMVVAYSLLFNSHLPVRALNNRFWPKNPFSTSAGIGLTWLGVAIAIWARAHIGEYWSARITLKEGHQLIRSGPYAYVRHPIYLGLLLASFGTALAFGRWRGLVAVVLILSAHWLKARKEERLMTMQFGQAYEEYRREAGFLIPRFR